MISLNKAPAFICKFFKTESTIWRKNNKIVVESKNPNYIVKPSEKIKVPEDKKNNNDIKIPPQNVTFSPQVNVNMGGVVIKNEVDIEKTAEMSKQKIIAELRNFVQVTK